MRVQFTGNKYWRVFASITFLNQVVRVPVFLILASSIKDLEAYFVIAATSIPVQFIAQDILQYRSKHQAVSYVERFGMPVFACGSIGYVAWHYGSAIGVTYLIFASALIFYGLSVGWLRDFYPAGRILAVDALYNSGITIAAVTALLVIQDGANLGLTIVLCHAVVAIAVGALNFLSVRRNGQSLKLVASPTLSASSDISAASALLLVGITVTTQLERLIIAVAQPAVLASVALAAGVVQAWRKVAMDDALVFERLLHRNDIGVHNVMRAELDRARRIFYPPLALAMLATALIENIWAWCLAHGVLVSLSLSDFITTALIICIYLAAMPPAIVAINTLRLRAQSINALGWCGVMLIITVEIMALIFVEGIAPFINLAMVLIILNASLYHILFIALSPERIAITVRLLLLDFGVLLLVVFGVLCVLFL